MSLTHSQYRQIAARYGDALFALALEQQQLDAVGADLATLKAAVDASDELRRMMKNPMISEASLAAAMDAIAVHMGAHALTKRAIHVMIHNKRLDTLPYVAERFAGKLSAHRGELLAEVITAGALSDKQREAIRTALAEAAGREVNLSTREDPAILGGLIVRIGSRMLDRSVAGKLQRLKTALTSAAA